MGIIDAAAGAMSGILGGGVLRPNFRIIYQGKDITADFAPQVLGVSYIDKRHGEADEASLNLQNSDGRWLEAWAPADGDVFQLYYGYAGNQVYAGEFSVDEWSVSGDAGGDKVEIKGLAAPKTKALRTPNTVAYEKTSLAEIVGKIAAKHGLEQEGAIEDISFDRITQNGERDLEFLKRLADDYGHYFTVKGKKLVFTSRNGLRARPPIMVISRIAQAGQMLKSYSLRKADHMAAQKAEVSYQHPQRKALVGAKAGSADDLGIMTASGDIMKVDVRVENEGQAKRVATSRLDSKNAQKWSGELELVGSPQLCAGAVVELADFGVFNGSWLITTSEHHIERSGYETKITIEKASDKNISDGKQARTVKSGRTAKDAGAEDLGVINAKGEISK